MKENKNVAIIGSGHIAKRLRERLEERGDKVVFSVSRKDGGSFESRLKDYSVDVVFLAISTLDEGEAARDYILACVLRGIPVVTCEKGSLASCAKELIPYIQLIGYTASVGGGTGMLKYVRERHPNNQLMSISVVLNGTLNYVFDEMSRGSTLWEACATAFKLGIAEPGSDGILGLINGEIEDVKKKICVFFNTVLSRGVIINPKQLNGSLVQTPDDLQVLSQNGASVRMMVSFSNHRVVAEADDIVGRGTRTRFDDGWMILAGFRKVAHLPEFKSWLPGGVGNAVRIIEGEMGRGGEYLLRGPGAGEEPTTSAMLSDFGRLCP